MFRVTCLALLVLGCAPAIAGQQAQVTIASIETMIRSQQYDEALGALGLALKGKPADFKLWTLQGICYGLQGAEGDALGAFDKALKLSPGYMPALKGEVQILYRTGDKRAIPLLKRMLVAAPGDETAREMLGVLEKAAGDCQAAVGEFALSQQAMGAHPDSLEAYGYCLAQLKRNDEAIPVFQKLIPLLPERTYPRYDLGILYVSAGKNQEAIETLQPLLTPDQSDPDILSLAARAYEASGDTPHAVEMLRKAIVLSPTTAGYYVDFATICLDHDSFQVGIDMIDAGLKHIAGEPSLFISRGVLYEQLGEFEKAEADFTAAESLDTAQTLGSYAADLTVLERNNPDLAMAHVRTQLKQHPESPLLRYLLAQLIMDQAPVPESAAFKEAKESVEAALKASPDMAGARDLLASIYMHSGQYDLAAEQCRLALQRDPNDEAAMYHLVISLRHSGHAEELPPLVKRLAALHADSRKQESDRKRYRLVEPGAKAF